MDLDFSMIFPCLARMVSGWRFIAQIWSRLQPWYKWLQVEWLKRCNLWVSVVLQGHLIGCAQVAKEFLGSIADTDFDDFVGNVDLKCEDPEIQRFKCVIPCEHHSIDSRKLSNVRHLKIMDDETDPTAVSFSRIFCCEAWILLTFDSPTKQRWTTWLQMVSRTVALVTIHFGHKNGQSLSLQQVLIDFKHVLFSPILLLFCMLLHGCPQLWTYFSDCLRLLLNLGKRSRNFRRFSRSYGYYRSPWTWRTADFEAVFFDVGVPITLRPWEDFLHLEMPFTRGCGTRVFPTAWGGSFWHHDLGDKEAFRVRLVMIRMPCLSPGNTMIRNKRSHLSLRCFVFKVWILGRSWQ